IRGAPHRMVQEIHGIRADREALSFIDADPLGERRIDAEVCRTFEPALACIAGRSRIGILEDDVSGAIYNHLVRETAGERRVSAKVWNGRGPRLEVFEVFDVTVANPHFSEIGQ